MSKVTPPPHTPLPAHLSLEWMTPGTPEDSHLAVAPLHFSLPLKHNSELSHHSPNKRYSSCIFNLLTDAIILYTPCSLILMQLLLFIAGRFSPPIILFESASPSVCVCVHAQCAPAPSLWSNQSGPTAELMNARGEQGKKGGGAHGAEAQ